MSFLGTVYRQLLTSRTMISFLRVGSSSSGSNNSKWSCFLVPTARGAATSSTTRVTSLQDSDLEEKFIRGSGPGGQKINKCANRVVLRHIPTGLEVSCQEHRDLVSNRRLARKRLTR